MAKLTVSLPAAPPRPAVGRASARQWRPSTAAGILLLSLLAIAAGMFQLSAPSVAPVSAPPTTFSAARAMQHLREIAREPHPIGSPANARVRDYLVAQLRALGLDPEVQTSTAVHEYHGVRLGEVQNVVVRLAGTEPDAAIMLAAHYDSVPTAPGASDDGAAVAAMLETARALKASSPLKRDVILLFTDGEEAGMLGARAFVDEHPWARDIALTLNFEARGSRGPALMFETSVGNRALIGGLAQAAPYPVAYSFLYTIYKLMPNNTDLTLFKELDTRALNFGYLFDAPAYHSMRDSVETIDPRSLQHHGSYMLALTRHWGNLPLPRASAGDAVFFTLWPGMLVHYGEEWALPLAVVVALLFVAVVVVGLRRDLLTAQGLVVGIIAFLLSALVSLLLVTLTWWAIQRLNPNYQTLLMGTTYETTLYLLAFTALVAAVMTGLARWLLYRMCAENLAVGALAVWTVLALLSGAYLPGFSYLFTWPLLAALLAALWRARMPAHRTTPAALALAAIPGFVLVTPAIYLLFSMLGLSQGLLPVVGVSLFLAPLLGGLLVPHFAALSQRARTLAPVGLLLLGVGLLIAANLRSDFEAAHPRPTSIIYSLDADTGAAEWISIDEEHDHWTEQFLGARPERGAFEIVPGMTVPALRAGAPLVDVAPPEARVEDDTVAGGVRRLRLRVTSSRRPWSTTITASATGGLRAVTVAGRRFELADHRGDDPQTWSMSYLALPEQGVELLLELTPGEQVSLAVSDTAHGLPEAPGGALPARPPDSMPASLDMTDSVMVHKTFTY